MNRALDFARIIHDLDAQVHHQASDFAKSPLAGVLAGDLMSDILTMEGDGCLLVSSLATDHVVRTADFVGARAVLLVNGKRPCNSLLTLARDADISLLSTPWSMFQACVRLGSLQS